MAEIQNKNPEIESIKKEIQDIRNLVNKTDNLVMNLSSDIKNVYKRQEVFYKRSYINGILVYVLFIIVIIFLSYKAFDVKIKVVSDERNKLREEMDQYSQEVKNLKEQIQIRDNIDKTILQALTLVDEGKKEEAADMIMKIASKDMTAFQRRVINDNISSIKRELFLKYAGKALDNINNKKLDFAEENIKKAYGFVNTDEEYIRILAIESDFYIKKGDSARAEEILQAASKKYQQAQNAAELYNRLALFYEMYGRRKDAINTYNELLKLYPNSPLAKNALRRIRALSKDKTE
ncbi:MAG: tetratricopeptide repeat protein [Deltaproteobacteria bacterium]|nr:tetratricopeptide repeat protein [Deltaproteobacteria bacterium]